MKTFKEACETFTVNGGDLVQFWADARAGMVPEAELADLRCKVEVLENSIRSYELSTGEHEAELAKAWKAGRDAAADTRGCSDPECCSAEFARRIRALQPPGGKP